MIFRTLTIWGIWVEDICQFKQAVEIFDHFLKGLFNSLISSHIYKINKVSFKLGEVNMGTVMIIVGFLFVFLNFCLKV